jgi:PTH2 family peptidyl-tRNA hydrolase
VKLVLLARTDLAMSRGKIAAQVAHAAVLAALNGLGTADFATWLEQGQPKVVLKVGDADELRRMAEAGKQAGLPISLVADAGRTQLPPGTLPAPRSAQRKTAGSTPLPVIYHCCERTDRGVAWHSHWQQSRNRIGQWDSRVVVMSWRESAGCPCVGVASLARWAQSTIPR